MNQPILRIISAFLKTIFSNVNILSNQIRFQHSGQVQPNCDGPVFEDAWRGRGKLHEHPPTPSNLWGKTCVLGSSMDRVKQEMSFLPWLLFCSWGQCAPRAVSSGRIFNFGVASVVPGCFEPLWNIFWTGHEYLRLIKTIKLLIYRRASAWSAQNARFQDRIYHIFKLFIYSLCLLHNVSPSSSIPHAFISTLCPFKCPQNRIKLKRKRKEKREEEKERERMKTQSCHGSCSMTQWVTQ